MSTHLNDDSRQVVPRWRPFSVASSMGLLDSARAVRTPDYPLPTEGEVEGLVQDWRRQQTPIVAANLIDAAVVLGRPAIAHEAARFIITEGSLSDVSLQMAKRVLSADQGEVVDEPPEGLDPGKEHVRIAALRRRLRLYPRDPLTWVDLAREYASLGELIKSEHSLRAAIALAPENRFVLRSASRFFLHKREPDRAHSLLRRADSTRSDPWLLAAEIVAASAAGRQSRMIGVGRRWVTASGIHPRHVSELACALGTLEHAAGNRRTVRKLFQTAFQAPTENAVAQASWIARHMPHFDLPEDTLTVPRAFEARAWEAALAEDYVQAVDASWEWLRDEPFATRSARFGSWVASVALGDFKQGSDLMRAALSANPDDPRLLAQLLYCEGSQGHVVEAEELLRVLMGAITRHPGIQSDSQWEVMLTADRGLIAYRRGDVAAGRSHYENAMSIAASNRLPEFAATAYLNLIREEALANPSLPVPMEDLERALHAYPRSTQSVMRAFLQQIPQLGV